MRSMIAGACTCLDSVAGDMRHLARDPLLSTRSPSDYLKKPAGSWGNGSLTQCRTNMPHSHSPSECCPAVTTHISALGRIFSIPARTTWIIILTTASAKLDFHNVPGKSSRIRSLPAGCRSIYWSVGGGVYITIGSSRWFEFKQSPGCGWKWSHKILKAPASRVMMAIIPDDCFLLGEAT